MVCLRKHHMILLDLDTRVALIVVLDGRSYFINYSVLIEKIKDVNVSELERSSNSGFYF